MRWVVLLTMAVGCGRLGFDPRGGTDADPLTGDGAADTAGSGGADAAVDSAPDGPPMNIVHVQDAPVNSSAGGPVTVTLPAASTAGTMLVAIVASNNPTSLMAPSGWMTGQQTVSAGTCSATIFFYPNNPGGITSVTMSINAGVPLDVAVAEFSGAQLVPLDAVGGNQVGSPQTAQTVMTSAPTAADGELAVATFCEDANSPTYTAPGWNVVGTVTTTSASPSFIAMYQLGAAATTTVTANATSSVGGKYVAAIATFKHQ